MKTIRKPKRQGCGLGIVGVKYHEVINMIKNENQFEERLNSLVLLKALLIKENAFNEVIQQAYQNAWEEMFELLKE